jgi:histone acetyltransferase 1
VKTSAFNASINDDIYRDWKPPGELVKTLNVGTDTYEVYKGNLMDKAIQQMIKRIQILVPLFIEGGSFIDMTDPDWSLKRWTVFFMFKNDTGNQPIGTSPYVFMGYATVYRYLPIQCLTPPSSPPRKTPIRRPATLDFTLPIPDFEFNPACRSRISQFLILPPFQGGGNGSRFYETIYQHYLGSSPETFEITVEDPNEDFDDLRDLGDLKRLRQIPEFVDMRINEDVIIQRKGRVPAGEIVDYQLREKIRTQVKMAPRQFTRLVEMQLLSLIPTYIRKSLLIEQKKGTAIEIKAKQHEYYLWQLFVKQRLYRHNKLSLMQLDRSERLDKLEDVVGNVEADFARILRTLEQRESPKKKRTSEDDGDFAEPASKKARIEEAGDA